MQIITFYSYKGGVGRSLSLANIASALASLGQTVGILDLDWEAAAQTQIFNVEVKTNQNLLHWLEPGNRFVSKIENYIVPVPAESGTAPNIFILPTITDSGLLNRISWDRGIEVFLSEDVLPTFERLYKLDYLLIDAKAGLSEIANAALIWADLAVLVCRMDRQNRFGIRRMIDACNAAAKRFLVVVSSCPQPNKHKAQLDDFARSLGQYPHFVLPYYEELYFNEEILVRTSPELPISKLYRDIALIIIKNGNENE